MPIEGSLGCAAGAVEDQRGGIAAGRADGEPFRAIADDDLIDDAGRVCLEVDYANGVDPAVLAAADVVDYRELAVGGDCDGDGQCRGCAATAGVGGVATDTVPTGFTSCRR
jgi:hypothetical protein